MLGRQPVGLNLLLGRRVSSELGRQKLRRNPCPFQRLESPLLGRRLGREHFSGEGLSGECLSGECLGSEGFGPALGRSDGGAAFGPYRHGEQVLAGRGRTEQRSQGVERAGQRSPARLAGSCAVDAHGGLDWQQSRVVPGDGEQLGLDQGEDHLAGLELGKGAKLGQLADASGAVDVAEQGAGSGVQFQVVGGDRARRGERHGVGAADRGLDGLPHDLAPTEVGEQIRHGHRRRDVVPGSFIDPEPPGSWRRSKQVRERLADLLTDDRIHRGLLDMAVVHQQVDDRPGREGGSASLGHLGQRLRTECPCSDEPCPDVQDRTGDQDGVHLAAPKKDLAGLRAGVNVQAATGHPVGQLIQEIGQRSAGKGCVLHARLRPVVTAQRRRGWGAAATALL